MNAELTVHHFGPDPSAIGGMESVIATLVSCSVGADDARAHPTWFRDKQLQSMARSARELAVMRSIPREDVIHVHLSYGGSFLREGAILLSAAQRGNPTVATIHGSEFHEFFDRHERLASAVLSRAAAITCLSDSVVEAVRRAAPGRHVELLPNPVADPEISARCSEVGPLVLFAGEVGFRKGADVLASAWPLVRREVEDARCVMVGPKTDLRLPEIPGMTVMDGLERERIAMLLAESRVVALPSRAEGMPMILTEALAAGRPFVATPVGGIPELAHAEGMLVPVGDAEGLAERLVSFLADARRAQVVGDAGRAFWERTRSVQVIDRRLATIYETVRRCPLGMVGSSSGDKPFPN